MILQNWKQARQPVSMKIHCKADVIDFIGMKNVNIIGPYNKSVFRNNLSEFSELQTFLWNVLVYMYYHLVENLTVFKQNRLLATAH